MERDQTGTAVTFLLCAPLVAAAALFLAVKGFVSDWDGMSMSSLTTLLTQEKDKKFNEFHTS